MGVEKNKYQKLNLTSKYISIYTFLMMLDFFLFPSVAIRILFPLNQRKEEDAVLLLNKIRKLKIKDGVINSAKEERLIGSFCLYVSRIRKTLWSDLH